MKFDLDIGQIIHWTLWTIQVVLQIIPWWIWVLVVIGIILNLCGMKISMEKSRQREIERLELLRSVKSIENQLTKFKK